MFAVVILLFWLPLTVIYGLHYFVLMFRLIVRVYSSDAQALKVLSLSHYLLIVQCSYPNSKHTICASGLPLLLCLYNLYAKGKYFGKWPISIIGLPPFFLFLEFCISFLYSCWVVSVTGTEPAHCKFILFSGQVGWWKAIQGQIVVIISKKNDILHNSKKNGKELWKLLPTALQKCFRA